MIASQVGRWSSEVSLIASQVGRWSGEVHCLYDLHCLQPREVLLLTGEAFITQAGYTALLTACHFGQVVR